MWIDPIVPLTEITTENVCEDLGSLYTKLGSTQSETNKLAFEYYLVKTNILM